MMEFLLSAGGWKRAGCLGVGAATVLVAAGGGALFDFVAAAGRDAGDFLAAVDGADVAGAGAGSR